MRLWRTLLILLILRLFWRVQLSKVTSSLGLSLNHLSLHVFHPLLINTNFGRSYMLPSNLVNLPSPNSIWALILLLLPLLWKGVVLCTLRLPLMILLVPFGLHQIPIKADNPSLFQGAKARAGARTRPTRLPEFSKGKLGCLVDSGRPCRPVYHDGGSSTKLLFSSTPHLFSPSLGDGQRYRPAYHKVFPPYFYRAGHYKGGVTQPSSLLFQTVHSNKERRPLSGHYRPLKVEHTLDRSNFPDGVGTENRRGYHRKPVGLHHRSDGCILPLPNSLAFPQVSGLYGGRQFSSSNIFPLAWQWRLGRFTGS